MICLRDDCLFVQQKSGDVIPCSAEEVTIELVEGSCPGIDPNVVRNAAAGVLHYFKHHLGREYVTLAEFSDALGKALQEMGYEWSASDPTLKSSGGGCAAPSATEGAGAMGGVETEAKKVTDTDLRGLAMESGKEYELGFFRRIRESLCASLEGHATAIRLHGLQACVRQLAGAQRWTSRCDRLQEHIVTYIRQYLSSDPRARGVVLVML